MGKYTRYDFTILIVMSEGNDSKNYSSSLPYKLSTTYKDNLRINGKEISISGSRKKNLNLDGIFNAHNSEVHNQIIKSLCYYFLLNGMVVKIDSVEVVDFKGNVKKFNPHEINQVTEKSISINNLLPLSLNLVNVIFESSEKGRSYYRALTHLVSAECEKNINDSFEKTWKAFNTLYKTITGKYQDNDCHIALRKKILENPNLFPLSVNYCSTLTEEEIRRRIRWIAMIQNDYKDVNHAKSFKCFVKRYSDYRIMNIIEKTLSVREPFLKEKGFYDEVVQHLDENIKQKTVNDAEIVTLLCIKYMYFTRNKSMHGEHFDSGFRLLIDNEQQQNTEWLKGLLTLLIIDIFNSHNSF